MRTYINKCLYYKESKTPGVAGRTDRDSTRGVFHGRPYIESLEKKGKGNASAPPVPPYRGRVRKHVGHVLALGRAARHWLARRFAPKTPSIGDRRPPISRDSRWSDAFGEN